MKFFDKVEVFGIGSSNTSSALTICNSANTVSFSVKDDGEVVVRKLTVGMGGSSEIFLNNNNSGKQLSLNSTTGSFNTITLILGTTGGISYLNTNGAAWGMNQSLRFDTAGVSQIYVNNGGNGLRLAGSNSSNSDLFIKGTADSTLGNVGINTSNPTAKLHVKASTSGDILAVNPTVGSGGVYVSSIANNPYILANNSGGTPEFKLSTNGDSYINGSVGNFGVGTLNPEDKLHIYNGTIRINDVNATYGVGKLAVSDANGSISFSSTTALGLNNVYSTTSTIESSGTTIIHNLNSNFIVCAFYDGSGFSVTPSFQRINANTISVTAITGNYDVVIKA